MRARNVELLPAVAVAFALVAPLLSMQGVPAFQHDWLWPVQRAQIAGFGTLGLLGWNPSGTGSPVVYPFPWWPNLWAATLCVVAGVHIGLVLVLLSFFSLAIAGCGALGRRCSFGRFGTATFAALFVANPFVLNKLEAGQIIFLASYCLLPWIAYRALTYEPQRWILTGVVIGIAAAQQQFIIFDIVVFGIFWPRKNLRDALHVAGSFGVAVLVIAPQWIGLLNDGSSGLSLLTPIHRWEQVASAPFFDAIRVLGYESGYDRRLLSPFVRGATWGIPFLALAGALTSPDRRRDLSVLAFGLVAAALSAGTKGPLASIVQAAFDHLTGFALFRELYDFAALTAFALAFLCGRSMKIFPLDALRSVATAASVGLAFAIAIPSASGLRPYAAAPQTLRALQRLGANGYRYATNPGVFPMAPYGNRPGGLSPYLLPFARHPSGLSSFAGGIATFGMRALDAGDRDSARRAFSRAGIALVAPLPGIEESLDRSIEPALAGALDRLSRPKTPRYEIVTTVAPRIVVEPFSAAPGTFATRYEGARDIRPFEIVSEADVATAATSSDPRQGWVRSAYWPWLPAWSFAEAAGVFTLRSEATLREPAGLYVIAAASGEISGLGCSKVLRIDEHWSVLRCGADPTFAGTPPLVVSKVATHSRAIGSRPLGGSSGSARVLSSRPDRVIAFVRATRGSALVLRENYDRGWRVSAPNVRHVEVDGFANAWVFARDYSGRVTIEYLPARMHAYAVLLSVILVVFAPLIEVSRRVTQRRRRDSERRPPTTTP